ncbi:WD repeat-containing protein 76 isoform X2 [Hyperolius riggenbachi]|uniref:WD repeat-containing protein 76 isoform X2 n=1 Tax=Hyperolius riggenbachi TaxID=752182 RepID=UPI0035A33847
MFSELGPQSPNDYCSKFEVSAINSEVTPSSTTATKKVDDMPSTPSKKGYQHKRLLKQKQHLEGTPRKKACLPLEESSVRRHPVVQLTRLKTEPENVKISKEDSDQEITSMDNVSPSDPPNGTLTRSSPVQQSSLRNNTQRSHPVQAPGSNPQPEIKEENPSTDESDNEEDSDKETTSMDNVSPSDPPHGTLTRSSPVQQSSLRNHTQGSHPVQAPGSNPQPEIKEENPSTDESDNEEDSDKEHMGLSAYERERLRNIKANAKFLNSIKLLESVASLRPPRKNRSNSQGLKREKPQKKQNTVVRRSMRLQRVDPSGVKLPDPEPTPVVEENPLKPAGPLQMVPKNHEDDPEAGARLQRLWSSSSEEKIKSPNNMKIKDLKRYEEGLKRLTLREKDVAKVVPSRIFSVAIHPSVNKTLVAAGDKWGNVGLWDLNDKSSDNGVYVFDLHSRPVGSLSFSPSHSEHLLSLSYDGTVRCGDVTRAVFDEIYRDEEESFSSFDFLSADCSVLIVSHWDSQISIVDRRTPGTTYEQRTSVGLPSARTVSVHPLQRDLCAVTGAGDVAIYDVRQLSQKQTRPVVSLYGHTRSVASAYFSPVTGNRILTASADDHIRVFDSSDLGGPKIPLLTSIRHNNNTGRWLTRFRPVWDPKQEDCFVVGSMARPRQIEVYHESGELTHCFWDAEYLNSVCSINAMHPTRDLLVGGNSSGRMHVFHD